MTIQKIIDSSLPTNILEMMLQMTNDQIIVMKGLGIEAKELIGWKNKLLAAISIRKAIEPKKATERSDRDANLYRKYGEN